MKSPNILLSIVAAVTMTFCLSTSSVQGQCTGDVIPSGIIDGVDLAQLLADWGPCTNCPGDIDGDGAVTGNDLGQVLTGWGPCPPPVLPWATVIEHDVDPAVVTDAAFRERMIATGLPWRIRDIASNIEMLLVPPGTFTMGCSASTQYACISDESPTHQVTLSAFYIGRYEVTQAQWTAKMGSNPSRFQGASYPDAASRPVEANWMYMEFWDMIASTGGFMSATGLRLPTEAEWEYAYRAGTTTAYHSYPAQPNGFNDDTLIGNIAWNAFNSDNQTHAVGGKLANALGLHDMAGNVVELCQDWYGPYSSASVTNPTGPTTGKSRVLRGGFFINGPIALRASHRLDGTPLNLYMIHTGLGFRVARNP